MSLMAAVDTAVRLQLARDKSSVALAYTKKLSAGGAGEYDYDAEAMLSLLEQIALRLRTDTPALKFDWARTDVEKCLKGTVATLVGLVAADTMLL